MTINMAIAQTKKMRLRHPSDLNSSQYRRQMKRKKKLTLRQNKAVLRIQIMKTINLKMTKRLKMTKIMMMMMMMTTKVLLSCTVT